MDAKYVIPYIEVHPTNRCNVVPPCTFCTYTPVARDLTLSLDSMLAFLKASKPSILRISGGGEPTVYRDGHRSFSDAIKYIRDSIEDLTIRVTTNGMSIRQLQEISVDRVGISLSASYYFGASLGRPTRAKQYWRVLDHLKQLLSNSSIPLINATFVYLQDNLDDLAIVAQDLFECVGKLPSLKEHNFSFHPLACADDTTSDVYHQSNLTQTQANRYREQIDSLTQVDNGALGAFLRSYTKINSPLSNKSTSNEAHCGMVKNSILIAADGNLYPCCVAAAKGQAALGTIEMEPEELYSRRKSFWNRAPADFCQWCRIKNTYMGRLAWDAWQ